MIISKYSNEVPSLRTKKGAGRIFYDLFDFNVEIKGSK